MTDILSEIETGLSKIDINAVVSTAAALVDAWPTLVTLGGDISAYISDLEAAFQGKPVDTAALHARLQAGTDALNAAAAADGGN